MARAPYLSDGAVAWCTERGVSIVGFDFYHATSPAQWTPRTAPRASFSSAAIITMPYLTNLWSIAKSRVTLISLPLKMKNVEASPIRAVVIRGLASRDSHRREEHGRVRQSEHLRAPGESKRELVPGVDVFPLLPGHACRRFRQPGDQLTQRRRSSRNGASIGH